MPNHDPTPDQAPDPAPGDHDHLAPAELAMPPERPVLEELPELAGLLQTLRQIDQLTASAVATIDRFQQTGEVEDVTGIPLELWLAADGRRTRSDRRMLATAADMRDHLPATFLAFRQNRISWSQLRSIVLSCLRLPAALLAHVDEVVDDHIEALADAEPDALVGVVTQALSILEPSREQEVLEAEERKQFVHLQPRLDGTGGRLYGDLGGAGFALVADALDPGPPPDATRSHLGEEAKPAQASRHQRTQAQRRAQRLVDLCAQALAGSPDGPGPVSAAAGSDPAGAGLDEGVVPPPVAPKILLTMTLDQLLGRSDVPAEILTTITGGRMKLTTEAARRWIDARGARFRGIVIEETGEILGVGRASYRPPGWLRDAMLARDATCTAPLCRVSAKISHLDHGQEWHDRGRTDAANLGWLHQGCHTLKRTWKVRGLRDGTRVWTHPRTGLTFRDVPTRRLLRPPNGTDPPDPRPGPARRNDRDPPGPRPGPAGRNDRDAPDPDLPF